jgi:hypothetical protein
MRSCTMHYNFSRASKIQLWREVPSIVREPPPKKGREQRGRTSRLSGDTLEYQETTQDKDTPCLYSLTPTIQKHDAKGC